MADQECPDCHVQPGQPHDLGCDMARCPACGIQRLLCDAHGDDRTLDALAVWTGTAPAVADDYRQRCADAAMKAWSTQAVLCDRSQIIPIGSIVDAVLAVRDDELEQATDLARKRGDHQVLTGQALDRSQAELRQAEAANARVRELHGEIPYKRGSCYCSNPYPCPTIRALDGEDINRG